MPDTEFDPANLFNEYVERLRENSEDPELLQIEQILQSMNYQIKIPEEEKREIPRKRVKSFKFFVANLYLIGPEGEIAYLSRQATITIPEPPQFDPKLSSYQDREFLKAARVSW